MSGERLVELGACCAWRVARRTLHVVPGEKVAVRNEKFVSSKTTTDLQGLDQARLISAKNL